MNRIPFGRLLALASVAAASAASAAPAIAAGNATTYVSPAGTAGAAGTSCATASYSSVQTAVAATPVGGTVVVCKGTYDESVTIPDAVNLQGQPGAIINAKGGPYAVGIGASGVTVSGLTVEGAVANSKTHAPGDGILTGAFVNGAPVASSNDVIVNNKAINNQGAGIDLLSTSGTLASGNIADHNGIGINLSNDLGAPAAHNAVLGNVADNNPGGCGIVLADHTGSGVFGNLIQGNTADGNGLGTPSRPNASSGSGVILAAAGNKGGVWSNVIEQNEFSGNGHAGVAVHIHVKGPKFSGNKVLDNTIGINNRRTDTSDKKTTGIYIGNAGKRLTITAAGNTIAGDAVGLFTAGKVTVKGTNVMVKVKTPGTHIPAYKSAG